MTEQRVTIEVNDGIADVRLARPEKMNAIDAAMFSALSEAGDEVAKNPAVRAVVLSGEGRAFCAGLDMKSFMNMGKRDPTQGDEPSRAPQSAAASASPANLAQRAGWVWQEVPVPVIAAVHGVAFGGGLQIALGADIRYVTPDAKLSVMEIKWGLIPDMSGTQTLRRLVRLDVAKELTFTGRVISGEEAVSLGLATHVADDPHAAAMELAAEIASKSPDAIRSAKRLLNESGLGTLSEGFKLEASLQVGLMGTKNQLEAVKANLEKRPPRFEDPIG